MYERQPAAKVQPFVEFVKNYFGSLVAVAGIPILADFFDILRAPGEGNVQKLITSLTALACALVLFILFSNRHITAKWKIFKTAFVGGFPFVGGGVLILMYVGKFPLPTDLPPKYEFVVRIILYFLGLTSLCAGSVVIFLSGFVRGEERLAQIIPALTEKEFDELLTLAKAIRGDLKFEGTKPPAQVLKVYTELSADVVNDAVGRINGISEGTLEIFGPDVNHAYARFARLVTTRLRAVSKDELDYWASEKSRIYLDLNKELIKRKCRVERTFLVPREPLEEKHWNALERQIAMGIGVRIAYLELVEQLEADTRLDFGLLDEFAVSFWDFDGTDRFFTVHIMKDKHARYDRQYDRIVQACLSVPDKQDGDTKLFESLKEFHGWKKSVLSPEPMA